MDINITDNKGSTPLHWAAYSGSFNTVNFLITWGSVCNIKDKDTGVTALHLASMQGNTRIVRKLLIKGIDRQIKVKLKLNIRLIGFLGEICIGLC
jgi:palmitoyltransferase